GAGSAMKTHLAAVCLLLALQQVPPKPTFKSSATLVEVDVVVSDRSGRPVRGLSRDDFTVEEDNTPVEIATFSTIDLPEAPRDAPIPSADRSGSAHASNDQPRDGRVVLIVLDDLQVSLSAARMATVKSIGRRAVERLGPSDLAAVVTTSGRLGAQTEFTTEKWRLLGAIDRFVPQSEYDRPDIASSAAAPPVQSQAENLAQIRLGSAMAGLTSAIKGLGTILHRRKSVLFVSQGFPAPLDEIIRDPRVGAVWHSIREFFDTAQRNNIAIYTVDPCGLERGPTCNSASRQSLRTIAESTNGFATVDTNAPELGVERMVAESGAYYFLTYYSPSPPNDGKRHRLKVTTRRTDVDVRAREEYASPAKPPKASPTVGPLDALLNAPIQARGLTMRIVAIPAPLASAPSAAVIVGIELPSAVAGRAGRVDFTVAAIDEAGKTRARLRFNTNFSPPTSATPAWTHTGSRIDIAPGRYQIRVAAVGADKTQGSVFTELTVPKFDTDLAVGGLALGAPAPGASGGADRLRGVLPLVPFASHDLAPSSTVEAQLPIRVSPKATASSIAITATLARPDGTTVQLDRMNATATEYAKPSGKVYRVAIPKPLAPGAHRLVVDTSLGSNQISREIAFRVTPY
ncbi:MAG: VWA domain-containing protein, partial [Vicinamibacterales bacterium]